jgi:AraC-like DNA-binding protein
MDSVPIERLTDPRTRPDAGAFLQDGYDVDTHWHAHDMHQIQYAFDGSIEVEDARSRYLAPRQLAVWIPAGVAHRTSLHDVRSGSLLFKPQMIPDAGERVRIVPVPPLMREMIIGAMRWPITRPLDETGKAYFAAFARLCAEWIRAEAPLWLPTTPEPRLRAAAAHTRENLACADLASACRAAGMSERTLRRRFRRELGMSWEAFRRRARLLRGVELLSETAEPIGVIAAHAGFESQSAFAKAFGGLMGETPRAFRARMGR